MDAVVSQRFCIVCGEPLEGSRGDDVLCPEHVGMASPAAPGRRAAPPGTGPPEPAALAAPVVLARSVPPLLDFAMAPGGVVYALDSALGGQACSVAAWKGGEFVSSAMLRVPEPLGIRMLDEGRPVLVGGSGTVVILGELAAVGGGQLPETVGHQLHRNITCVAKQPHADVLALGVPEGDEVVRLGLPGFATSSWLDGLPARPVALAFSSSGDRLATGLDDGGLLVVDTRSGERAWLAQPSGFDGLGVVACAAGTDGGWVVAYESEHLAVWDSTGRPSAVAGAGFAVSALHVDPGSGRVAVGGLRGELSVLGADLGRVLASAPARGEPVVRVLLLPGADTLVSASEAGEVEGFELH